MKKAREVPKLFSLEYASPGTLLGLNDVFDLATRALLDEAFDANLVCTVAVAFELLGLNGSPCERIRAATHRASLADALAHGRGDAIDPILSMLWRQRTRLARLCWAWDHVIEGDPILGTVPGEFVDAEIRALAARVLGTARLALDASHAFDARIARSYGALRRARSGVSVRSFRYCDLAAREPLAVRLSSLYTAEEFRVAAAGSRS